MNKSVACILAVFQNMTHRLQTLLINWCHTMQISGSTKYWYVLPYQLLGVAGCS